MTEAIVITPVKDSLNTTIKTVQAIAASDCDISYFIYDDFSSDDTKKYLDEHQKKYSYKVIHLEDVTSSPSPNYKLVLQLAQKRALDEHLPLIIVESDVIVKKDTISSLIKLVKNTKNAGMIGAITTNTNGEYNFPYEFEKTKSNEVIDTNHSLSFCCTLINTPFLEAFDFNQLSAKKDWYDIFLSRQSKKMDFKNYLAKGIEVVHLPHSSRPWKQLKYSNPMKYYLNKYLNKRDRI